MDGKYENSPEAYVERVARLRKAGGQANLVYAALELRCGIEARLRETVAAVDRSSKSQRREYRASKLGKTIEEAFQSGDQMMVLFVTCKALGARIELKFFPVSARLRKIHDELGDFLHHPLWDRGEVDGWWQRLASLVKEGFGELQMSSAGELTAMPVNRKGEWHLPVRLPPSDPRVPVLETIFDGRHEYEVEHFVITPVGRPTYYES